MSFGNKIDPETGARDTSEHEPSNLSTDAEKLSVVFKSSEFYPMSREEMDSALAILGGEELGDGSVRKIQGYITNSIVTLSNANLLGSPGDSKENDVNHGDLSRIVRGAQAAAALHRDIRTDEFVKGGIPDEFKFKTEVGATFSKKPRRTIKTLLTEPEELGRESFDQALDLLRGRMLARKKFWESRRRETLGFE